jgi:RHS repeat-associated protein
VQKTDMVLPARLPIAIERGYQSGRKEAAGPFGKGTFFNFEKQAQSTESGLVITYAQGNGRIDLLTRQPDGTFQSSAVASLHGLVLTPNADGSKTIRRKDGSIERYSTTGRLVGLEERNGNTITIERGGNDQIVRIVDASGLRALTFQYDASGRIQQITDPINRTVQYAYNAAGYLDTMTDPAGGITRYGYDATGNLLTVTDPRNIAYLTNEYDSASRVIRQTLADGSVSTASYETFGTTVTATTVTDPRGNRSTTRFNAQSYSASTVDSLGQAIRKTFNADNQVIESRDSLNRVTKYTYDAAGNVTSTIDPQGNSTIFEYEPTFNQVTKITDALNQVTRFTYDPATGNLLTATDPLNHTTTIVYNAFGQPTSVTDPLNQTTTITYNAVGNLETVTDSLGNRSQRLYDVASRLTALIDPRGKTTQFAYDPLNQVTQITDAINGLTGFTYDPNGNLLTVTDAKNQTTTYTYDNMDRLATRKDALNRTESYQYDLAGNLTQLTDRKNQVTTFQYDPLDRQTSVSYADGSSVAVVYDAVGNASRLTDSTSGAIEWTYDVLDRVIQEAAPQGIVRYTYDALSRRLTLRANAQPSVTYSYDANSQLSQVALGTLSAVLTHDGLGRRTQLQRSNGVTTTYNYDLASRLIGLTHAKGATVLEQLTQGFDQADNKTQVTQLVQTATTLPPAVTAAYNAANAQTQFTSGSPQTLNYDSNGNLAGTSETAGSTTYTWDTRDRLTGITAPNLTASFQYDALDRRISKTINGVTTSYQYDGADLLTETGPTQASYLSTLNTDEPIVRQTLSGNEFYLANDLGSILALTDDSGAVTTTYTYGPFGATTINGASTNPVQFTGRENDGHDLYYYRARYYQPSHGRFLSEDPLGFGGGDPNFYAYVFNNPINYSDPSGEIIPPLLLLCLRGAGQSIAQDIGASVISGRKIQIDWGEAGISCLTGGLNKVAKVAKVAGKTGKASKKAGQATTPYKRPSGSTTQAQRESVQGKPCVKCGAETPNQVAGHKEPLVKEHYETGTIDKQRMRSLDAVQPECPTCSAREGAEMSRYSREMKGKLGP